MDDTDRAKVRSAVGSMIGVGWVMDVVHAIVGCWNGGPDRCMCPTMTRVQESC